MKLVHNISLSVFVKFGEDEERIRKALLSLVPLDLEKEKLKVERQVTHGFEHKIIVLGMSVSKERHARAVLEFLLGKLTKDQKRLILIQENRLDDECFFYLRFDKNALLGDVGAGGGGEGCLELTDSGDCFHVKMSIAAYPKKREAAVVLLRKIFS
ncbi:hypothetical protein JW711_03070 [Candidatus Woesearchaeota archaeon]|nr:hypothetical protein [Candidatus Woesearchaeota archaeon]